MFNLQYMYIAWQCKTLYLKLHLSSLGCSGTLWRTSWSPWIPLKEAFNPHIHRARLGRIMILSISGNSTTGDEWTPGQTALGLVWLSSGPGRGQQRPPAGCSNPGPHYRPRSAQTPHVHWFSSSNQEDSGLTGKHEHWTSAFEGRSLITSRRHHRRRRRSNLLHGCWGCGDALGWDACFSPDMTDAAHYAADRTLLALHDKKRQTMSRSVIISRYSAFNNISLWWEKKTCSVGRSAHINAWQVMDVSGSQSRALWMAGLVHW